jgi:hypothetical protein
VEITMLDVSNTTFPVRDLMAGMGLAVAERTVLRKDADGQFETWGDVASRVALGNSLLVKPGAILHDQESERDSLERAIAKATILMSGRHLQHGDETQPQRNLEVFSNCATSAVSFLTFMLLLNGAGVGRCYDDDLIITNWDNAPNLHCVLSSAHADFDWSQDEDVRDARHKYAGANVVWHGVADTREGWAKAIELWESMAYQKVYRDTTLVLDFSAVRPRGAPIMGMQGRSSSGPKPLMNALTKCATLKSAGMAPWMQAMYMDHYLAECVLVGGARRAARMSTKDWRDPGIFDFIRVKRPTEYQGKSVEEVIAFRTERTAQKLPKLYPFLWSSNNSVTVDQAFWDMSKRARTQEPKTKLEKHAAMVLRALAEAAYGDGTGEPGIINSDKLRRNDTGWTGLTDGSFVGSKKYQVEDETRMMLARLAKIASKKPYVMTTNPCGEISISVLGGYCVIGTVVPYHADTLLEAEEAFRTATRALIRVNTMDNLYSRETKRTNRIGVGITGIHEFAWKFFNIGFKDLVSPDFDNLMDYHYDGQGSVCLEAAMSDRRSPVRAAAFWLTMARFSRAVQEEAASYAAEIGVAVPHTALMIAPNGTIAKLFGLTEGWHLPAMAQYLRWVQFRFDDPLVEVYKALGYPTRELVTYSGTIIVGFPTQPVIGELGMGDALVTASEATPHEQYAWLKLGEEYWIKGTDQYCNPLHKDGEDVGNQISYTLKYDAAKVSYDDFLTLLVDEQSEIRCCSVMPVEDDAAYEYLPEQALDKAEYEGMMRSINSAAVSEDIGLEHIDCASGACPITFTTGTK